MAYKNAEDRRAYHRQYMRERRAWYKQHGLCTECGKEDAYTMVGRPRCFECQQKHRKHPVEYIKPDKPTRQNFRQDRQRCYLCGAPVIVGETAWSGKPFRVCREHYEHMKRIAAKGREAYQERHGETWGNSQYRLSQKSKRSDNTVKSLLPYTSYSRCATPYR